MPQLSPLNWFFLFSMFWIIMFISSSIMWWNTLNHYKIMKPTKNFKKINFNW
uniref:ATP synthase F0 subunit 8 n=1 Tax=Metasepia tullbergi TaxID=279088 RepID=A0A7T8G4I4_9MOLL|nr:ATP synthase F0 subunit 8 [Metasepia tullbergi]